MERHDRNREIGKRVREIREYQKLSRERLAEKADISTQFLSDIELGRKSMTTTTLCSISTALMVSADYLLFGTEAREKSAPLAEMLRSLNKCSCTVKYHKKIMSNLQPPPLYRIRK